MRTSLAKHSSHTTHGMLCTHCSQRYLRTHAPLCMQSIQARRARITRYARIARMPCGASWTCLACIAHLSLACSACCAYRPRIAWTRKIAGQCTHCHRTNRKTSAVSVTHRCKSSTDREQLGCHDHPIARRFRHRIETCDSPSRSDCQGSRRDATGQPTG